MIYQYNNVTGRISQGADPLRALNPVAPLQPSNLKPPTKIQYDPSIRLSTISASQAKGKGKSFVNADGVLCGQVSEKIRKRQELFQKPNDIPIYLKGGPWDKIFYRATCAGVAFGGVTSMYFIIAYSLGVREFSGFF